MTANELLMLFGTKSLILFAAALIAWTLLFVTKVRTPLTHRIVWFSVLLLGIIGAGVPVTVFVPETAVSSPWSAASVENESVEKESVLPTLSTRNSATHNSLPVTHNSLLTTHNSLLAVWFTVFVLLLLRRAVSYFVLLHQLQSAVPVNNELYLTLLKNHRIHHGKLPLLLTTGIGPALVRRLTGSVIVIPPELWEEADNSVRRGIIEHEIAHYVQKDILVCGLARLLAAVHWFNPAAWFAARKFEEATEWACDAAAFGNQESGERCLSESLLIMHETMPNIVLNRFSFGGGKLSRRLSFLHSIHTQPKESVMKKFFVFGILVLVLVAGTVSVRIAAQEKAQGVGVPTTPPAPEQKEYQPGQIVTGLSLAPEQKKVPDGWDKTLWQRVPGKQEGMVPWASYIIEPPDVLHIQAINLVPKAPYRLRAFDVVAINVTGLPEENPIAEMFSVEPGGKIQLGSSYGFVNAEGLAIEQLEKAVVKHLTNTGKFKAPLTVSVKLARMTDMQQIEGKRPVSPDGTITLGSYGRVNVVGLSVPDCQKVIEEHLSQFLDRPQVSVDVSEIKSKNYYVITRSKEHETIQLYPCTGNDTVMTALTGLKGFFASRSNFDIQHIRPGTNNADIKITPLEWDRVLLYRAGFGQNLQLLPGDRIIITARAADEPKIP